MRFCLALKNSALEIDQAECEQKFTLHRQAIPIRSSSPNLQLTQCVTALAISL
jgi:hypothetical protein